ncbi:hypothetical protein [Paenibacillus gansuensis]|uniref:Uncharacterized protein n=1 Tax=Paenibacillus gansuensis TaxID=306542 RepID=A0ABW5P9M1_9BACL
MNPGYIALLCCSIVFILCASGWKDVLFRGVRHRTILMFFTIGLPSVFINWDVSGQVKINGGFVFLLICTAAVLFRINGRMLFVQTVTASVLLGSVLAFVERMSEASPVMILYIPVWEQVLLLGLINGLFFRDTFLQVAAITLQVAFAVVIVQFLQAPNNGWHLGMPGFYDRWCLLFTIARGASVCWEFGEKFIGNSWLVQRMKERGWRK